LGVHNAVFRVFSVFRALALVFLVAAPPFAEIRAICAHDGLLQKPGRPIRAGRKLSGKQSPGQQNAGRVHLPFCFAPPAPE
jgi:hypothetical protein